MMHEGNKAEEAAAEGTPAQVLAAAPPAARAPLPSGNGDTVALAPSRPAHAGWRRHLVLPALIGLLAGGACLLLMTPRYLAQTLLSADIRPADGLGSRSQIISSREFARQILSDNALTVRLANLAGMVDGAAGSSDAAALRAVEQGLTVTDRRDGTTAVSFVASDAALATDVANAFADGYVRLRQAKAAFNMEPGGPISTGPRLAARAELASALPPTRGAATLLAALAGFGVTLAGEALLRRRRAVIARPAPQLSAPELPASGLVQHLPWIGGETLDFDDGEEPVPRRRLSRDGELADLARLVELRGEAARLVVVTGAAPDDGIARCALALGRALASTERRVVIVCLDVAASPLDELTDDPRAPGLTDLLFGVASFSDAIHREPTSRCHVIPPGRGAREADGLVAADRLVLILRALEQTYDHVVVAAPPLGPCEGAQRIAALKPTVILVTRPGGAATDAVQAFDELAEQGFGEIAMVTFAVPVSHLQRAA
ncbi:tyrosine-protein kinase family protein [Ancylobacter amanitiformis]|uniref:Mrp family chromosome partitioning ATPase n=1 Tax=Ancylobacter amanitiformis TaxID=217069 RepID=A0ABU0LQ53_9HYPH|nr:lipopolysaccharide biosynthesis protein [Ancylobacter amanitiformis]MDQ0510809.1 Mrp family chromosome partitioning ATPase [Ancylobacter amanitiformis]